MQIQQLMGKWIAAACLALAIPMVYAAADHAPGMPPKPPRSHGVGMPDDLSLPMPLFLRGIELNENQRDEVFSIIYEQMPALRKHSKVLRGAQEKLQAMAKSTGYDEGKVNAWADEIAKETVALTLLRARSEQMIYKLLTPEQRKQLDEMKQHHSQPMAVDVRPSDMERAPRMPLP